MTAKTQVQAAFGSDDGKWIFESMFTYVAKVKKIERWKDSSKYILYFTEPAKPICPIKLIPKPNGKVKAPQAPRYTSFERLMKAKNLDEAF
jgi:hypothetical protein